MLKAQHRMISAAIALLLGTLACSPAIPDFLDSNGESESIELMEVATEVPLPTPMRAEEATSADEPVQVTGEIEVTNESIFSRFVERYVYLQDLTGFIGRDFVYEQPLNAQVLGPVTAEGESVSYVLNLPAAPISPLNDVDHDGNDEPGVQIWMVVMTANFEDDPFKRDDETGGWGTVYTSARIDSENDDEIAGGKLLIWSPNSEQEFPNGFGADGLLFTADDPVDLIPAGYTLIDLDAEPFAFQKSPVLDVFLYEGDIQVNDLADLTYTEAFDALWAQASVEYPFTELKNLDWDALYDTYAPRIAAAEQANDPQAFFATMSEFAMSIPDGHVSMSGDEFEYFWSNVAGGYGFAVTGLDNGMVFVHVLLSDGQAAAAGMEWGAEILEWNGRPVQEVVAEVIPDDGPHSSEITYRATQYTYLTRDPVGTQTEITFKNPAGQPQTVRLEAEVEVDTFFETYIFGKTDSDLAPLEYEVLDSGVGYMRLNSLSGDLSLLIRLWKRAITYFNDRDVTGIILDLRNNGGGAPLGSFFAEYFITERIEWAQNYYYSEETGEFEPSVGPPDYSEPEELHFAGDLAVLVSPACASACEDVAWVLSQLPQTTVVGFYPSMGIFGEVARGEYSLPGDYTFIIPTGMARDMEGNIIIEGTGVVPDERLPLNTENAVAVYRDGIDVELLVAESLLLGG